MSTRLILALWLFGLAGWNSGASAADPPSGGAAPGAPPRVRVGAAEKIKRDAAMREFLQKLAPEKRRQVVAAMRKVWDDDEVKAARDELKASAANYKRTMRQAVDESDPDVREIVRPLLERLMKDGLAPGPPAPGPDRAPRLQRLFGLGPGKLNAVTPEDRRLLASVRDRVLSDPRVKSAIAKLGPGSDPAGARGPALRDLRRTARAVAVEIEPQLGPLLERMAEPEGGTK